MNTLNLDFIICMLDVDKVTMKTIRDHLYFMFSCALVLAGSSGLAYGQTPTLTPVSCCGSPGGVLFQDTYSSNASLSNYNFYIGDTGATDPNYANYFSVSGGYLIDAPYGSNYSPEQILVTDSNFSHVLSDYTVQCVVNMAQAGNSGIIGVIFRAQDGGDFYSFQWNETTGQEWQVEYHTSTSWNYLANSATPAYTYGSSVTLKVVCCGTDFKCYVNNQMIFDVTDSTYTSGAVGIRGGYIHSTNQSEFSNFTAYTCSITATPTPTFTPTKTSTPTPTNTPTLTQTPTITPTFTMTPTEILSGLGKTVLAPVPVHSGEKICLYPDRAIAGSHWEVYNFTGESLANLDFNGFPKNCWDTTGVAPGVYLVRLEVDYADGTASIDWKKILVIR